MGTKIKHLLAPGLKYYVIATVPFLAAFFLVPFELYYNGQDYWNFGLSFLLRLPVLGLLACAVTLVLLRLLAALRPRLAMDAAVALFCLGLFLLLADLYAPLQISELDGSELTAAEPLAYTFAEIVIATGLVFAFLFLRRNRYLMVAQLFAVGIIAVSLGYGTLIMISGREASSQVTVVRPQSGLTGNVYHIVLDEMQTDAFLHVLEKTPYAADFDGFEVFRNNIANYIVTTMSLPSYFTGTFYHEGDLADWQESWRTTGLLAMLGRSGYARSMYAPFKDWNNDQVDRFTLLMDVYEEETGTAGSDFPEFVILWLVRLAPNFLAAETLALSTTVREDLLTGPTLGGAPAPSMTHGGRDSLASVFMLRRLIADEKDRMSNGEYVYGHAILPHQPYVMNENCRYDPSADPKARSSYVAQVQCTIKLMSEFVRELKRLGRYDAATIVVHSDTGSWSGFFPDARPASDTATVRRPEAIERLSLSSSDALPWIEMQKRVTRETPVMAARVSALLMIKPPHATDPFQVAETATQLVDVFPTLLDILDHEPPRDAVHGRSVYEIEDGVEREARYAFRAQHELGYDVIEVRIEDQLDLFGTELTLVGPAIEPGVWREELRRQKGIENGASH